MPTLLKITDSLGSLNLMDNVNYRLTRNQWTPSVAGLVDDLFQPNGPYGTCEEEITIDVLSGASGLASTVMSNAEIIADKIMAAERWFNGEKTLNGAVYLEYSPSGASSEGGTPYRALILGRTDRDKPGAPITLPPEFGDIGNVGTLEGVRIRLLRQGWWLAPEENATSSTVANPGIMTANFVGGSQQFSALRVEYTGLHDCVSNIGNVGGNAIPCGIIAITNNAKYIQYYEGETGGGFAYTPPAGEKASAGQVARFTANSNVEALVATWPISVGNQVIGEAGQIAIIGMVRNNSVAGTSWQLRFVSGDGPYDRFESDPVTIPAGQTWPRAYVLGVMETGNVQITQFRMYAQAPGTTDTLDIDYVALVGLPNDDARIIVLNDDTSLSSVGFGSFYSTHRFRIDHKLFVARQPFVGIENAAGLGSPSNYRGDPLLLTGGDNTVTGKVVTSTIMMNDFFHWVNCTPGNVIISNQMKAYRRQAFIVPQ